MYSHNPRVNLSKLHTIMRDYDCLIDKFNSLPETTTNISGK